MISCVLSLWLTYFDGTTSSLGNNYPTHKLRIVFSEYYAALQMVFSLLINSNGKKSSVLLDSILTHLYATKFLKIWVSENPISSHLVQSEVTSSTLIPNVTRRLYIRFVNSISTPAEMKKRWSLFSTHIQLFFLAVCILWNGIQFLVFIVWLTFAIAIEGSLSSHLKRNLQGNSDSRYILRNCSDQYFHWAGCNKRVQFGHY